MDERFFEMKMKFGIERLTEELVNGFMPSRWLSHMEQLDQENYRNGKEYIPCILKNQHARAFMQKLQSVMQEHIEREVDERVRRTNIGKQLDMLQHTAVIRQVLQSSDIPIEDRDIFHQDVLSFDDVVEDGILSMLGLLKE